MNDHYDFELLTPCFCHGATKTMAEMRIPSIRGHLRRWHTILYGSEDMKQTWGTASGKVVSSRVILRLLIENNAQEGQMQQQVLPHVKRGPKTFSCSAVKDGMRYRLQVSCRSMTSDLVRERVDRVITSWLYLGCVGMRSSRAFGSVWPQAAKPEWADFSRTGKRLYFQLLHAPPEDKHQRDIPNLVFINRYLPVVIHHSRTRRHCHRRLDSL